MTIILDFDRTLFDTNRFRRALPVVYFIKVIFWRKSWLKRFVFDDTIPFLEAHAHTTLILMTYGLEKYQQAKISGSGLTTYFKKVIVTKGLKGKEIRGLLHNENYQDPIVFVDDRLYQLESVLEECPEVLVIRMRRPEQPDSGEGSYKGYYEVSNMQELTALLKTL